MDLLKRLALFLLEHLFTKMNTYENRLLVWRIKVPTMQIRDYGSVAVFMINSQMLKFRYRKYDCCWRPYETGIIRFFLLQGTQGDRKFPLFRTALKTESAFEKKKIVRFIHALYSSVVGPNHALCCVLLTKAVTTLGKLSVESKCFPLCVAKPIMALE